MTAIDAIAISIIGSLIFYSIKRIDEMDKRVDERLDALDHRLTHFESLLPKRKSDRYYSENSGIEM